LDDEGGTLADLAGLVEGRLKELPNESLNGLPGAVPVGVVLVTGPELGTLNVTELTVEALRRRNVPLLGLVIGCWPSDPGAAELGNLADLPELTGVPLLGLIPEGPPRPPILLAPTAPSPPIRHARTDQHSIDTVSARP
jgi:dethiobiotin synthetase